MKGPVRWLDPGGNPPAGAAELLSAVGRAPEFSDALRSRLAVGVAKTASLPLAPAWHAFVAKAVLVAGVGAATGYGVHILTSRPDAPPVVSMASPAPMPSAANQVLPQPISVEALPALQLPTAPPDRAPSLKLDVRLAEAEVLEKARSLVGSNPALALKLTAEHARDFPRGRLHAEAELIAAQALLAMGNAPAAKRRAEASLRRYPNGLYARQLREIADAP